MISAYPSLHAKLNTSFNLVQVLYAISKLTSISCVYNNLLYTTA